MTPSGATVQFVVHGRGELGWELRHGGRWNLYRNRRVNGKPVKEYLAASDRFGFGELMAHELDRLRRQAKVRKLTSKTRKAYRARIDELLATASAANTDLRSVAGSVVCAGVPQAPPGRMANATRTGRSQVHPFDQLQAAVNARAKPTIDYQAPADDAQAVELFAKARTGDAAALARVHAPSSESGSGWTGSVTSAAGDPPTHPQGRGR